MTTVKIHCFVSGKVQGVFFRAAAQKKAVELGVRGSVKNMRDGRVEVYAAGDAEAMQEFKEWLDTGPTQADVDDVDYHDDDFEDNFTGFDVLR